MVATTGSPQDAGWLGADAETPRDTFLAVFVPSEERDGQPLDHEYWRNEAVREISQLFGGATSIKGVGGWLDRKQGGRVKEEDISIVFSFFALEEWHEKNVSHLKEFLYRMGRDAKQGAVAFYFSRPDSRAKYIEIPSESYEEE